MKGISIAGQTAGEAAWSISMFGLSLVVTAMFGYFLITEPARLNEIWEWTRSQSILVQGVVWLLFLPWMIALWIWSMPWALPVRLVLVVCMLGFTVWLLFPWKP